MDHRRRKDIPLVEPEMLQHIMQTMIGQGLRAHFEVPQQTPDGMRDLTARIDEPHQAARIDERHRRR